MEGYWGLQKPENQSFSILQQVQKKLKIAWTEKKKLTPKYSLWSAVLCSQDIS